MSMHNDGDRFIVGDKWTLLNFPEHRHRNFAPFYYYRGKHNHARANTAIFPLLCITLHTTLIPLSGADLMMHTNSTVGPQSHRNASMYKKIHTPGPILTAQGPLWL